jgi:hypothetical protein
VDGLARPPGDSRHFSFASWTRGLRPLGITYYVTRSAAPRASQGEGQQKRFEKILRQELDCRNCDAIAHEAEGLIDVR